MRGHIIDVAIEAFGARGFDGVSTRDLGSLAGVSAPALQYYFGGKENLYLTCADHISATFGTRLAPIFDDARRVLANEACSRAKLLGSLHTLLSAILSMLLEPGAKKAWVLFLVREQAHPTAAFDMIFERLQGPLVHLCMTFIGRLAGLKENDPRVAIIAFGLYSQILSFRLLRETALRVLRTKELESTHVETIKSLLLDQIRSLNR
jgi:TetR/AcrR family transcriptional regulator, regulator of cefoperazone and chloramphenicol sensitivity